LKALHAFPMPRLKPHVSDPSVMIAVRRSMARAGYNWDAILG